MLGMLAAMVGVVSGVGGALGAVIGNRINVQWIRERVAEHTAKLAEHANVLQAHEIKLALLEREK